MQNQFPPGGGSSDDEAPTIRVRPPQPGQEPSPQQPPTVDPFAATQRAQPPSGPSGAPGGFPPAPQQPGFGAPPSPPQQGFGSQPYGAPPQQPGFGAPPQGFPPPQQSDPAAPGQPGFGAPPPPPPGFGAQPYGAPPPQQGFGSQPYGAPPQGFPPPQQSGPAMPGQPGYAGPPPTFGSAPTYGGPAQPGFGPPPPGFAGPGQPGFGPPQPGFPGGPGAPPPKKGKSGLIIGIVVVLLVIIVGGVLAFALLKKGPNTTGTNGTSATATPKATATQAVPSGFQQFSNSNFSVIYPQAWTAKASSSGEQFTSASGQIFEVDITSGGSDPSVFDSAYCGVIGKVTAGPTTVTIGGEKWTQEECQDQDGTLDSVVEAVAHNGNLFSIAYLSLIDTIQTDKTQFYQPMEQSFKFLS